MASRSCFARRDPSTKKHKDLERLFDANWYLQRYPEAATAAGSPLSHYLKSGAAAGYDPHPMFCTTWYLDRYPDVASVGMNPLVHYVTHGAFEGRDPHPLFDTSWYLNQYPQVSLSGRQPAYPLYRTRKRRRPQAQPAVLRPGGLGDGSWRCRGGPGKVRLGN